MRGKKIGILLALCLSLCSVAPARLEAAEEDYTYKIRIFAGAQGNIDGQEMVEYPECSYGQRITFSQNRVTLKDNSKYYIRGIRRSGRDNDEILSAVSFEVKEDADYVVAYGILGDAVMYTVEYVDEAGNILAPSETYYGNVGDRPVVAFAYIEGYQPQAYNLTGVLESDASRNVFRFTYSPVAQVLAPQPEETQPSLPAGEETPAQEAGETPVPGTEVFPPEEETTEPGVEIPEEEVPLAEPDEIQDIRDPEVPLADGSFVGTPASPNGFARVIGNIPLAAKMLIGLTAVAAAGTAWFFLMHRRRKSALEVSGKNPADQAQGRDYPGK